MKKDRPRILQVLVFVQGVILLGLAAHCAPVQQAVPAGQSESKQLVVGHAYALLLSPTSRPYVPQLGLVEVIHRSTGRRVDIELAADRQMFFAEMPPGDYVLGRVQIHEGPFLSLAQPEAGFTVHADRVTYLGTWRFGVESPRYGRMIVVSAVEDAEDRVLAERAYALRHPDGAEEFPAVASLLTPRAVETRLYEVAPYPRIQPYFRRHWW